MSTRRKFLMQTTTAAIVVATSIHLVGYTKTGPRSLSQLEQVATIGDVIGRSLRFEEMSPEEARRELLAPPSIVNMLLEAWVAAIGLPAFVTSTVAEITGTPARTFRDWVTDHAAESRA